MRLYNEVEEILRGAQFGGIEVAAGQKLYGVMPGDTVRVKATVQYRGPAWDDKFYVGIGEWRGVTWPTDIGFFDEHWNNKPGVTVNFAAATDWVTYELTADVLITRIGVTPWTPGWFDIYAKLDVAKKFTPRLDNVIEVILVPEFRDFNVVSYDRVAGA